MTDDLANSAIPAAAAAAVAAELAVKDPRPALAGLSLSDLVRLQDAIDDLAVKLRGFVTSSITAVRAQAAVDVPLEGPVAECREQVVYHIRAYVRDGAGGQSLDWATSSCAAHRDAYAARTEHQGAFAETATLPLRLIAMSRCGKVNDYRQFGRGA